MSNYFLYTQNEGNTRKIKENSVAFYLWRAKVSSYYRWIVGILFRCTGIEKSMSFAYLSDKKTLTKEGEEETTWWRQWTYTHTHSGTHVLSSIQKHSRRENTSIEKNRFIRFLFVSSERLQDNSGSISGGIGQREALCSGDDAFLQTVLMIGTAHCVRGSKWYREEITLSERAYVIGGDDLGRCKTKGISHDNHVIIASIK